MAIEHDKGEPSVTETIDQQERQYMIDCYGPNGVEIDKKMRSKFKALRAIHQKREDIHMDYMSGDYSKAVEHNEAARKYQEATYELVPFVKNLLDEIPPDKWDYLLGEIKREFESMGDISTGMTIFIELIMHLGKQRMDKMPAQQDSIDEITKTTQEGIEGQQ